MDNDLLSIYSFLRVKQIPSERNYWLIRTDSGKFFTDFITNNYVAIGWDEFSSKEYFSNHDEKKAKEQISKTYPNEQRPGYIYNQIKRFIFDIKKDDMILIPSENSSCIAFGTVIEEFYIRPEQQNIFNTHYNKCKFRKSIRVKWESMIPKEKLDPYFKMLLFTHTTISNVNDYKHFINRLLYSAYILDDITHVTFNITTNQNINVSDLLKFLTLVSQDSIDVFNQITGENLDKNSIQLKINVQSPGPVEFIGYATGGIIIICAVCALLFGIKLDISFLKALHLNVNTPGLLTHILEFIKEFHSNNQETQKLKNQLLLSKKQLKLKIPEEMIILKKKKDNKVKIAKLKNQQNDKSIHSENGFKN